MVSNSYCPRFSFDSYDTSFSSDSYFPSFSNVSNTIFASYTTLVFSGVTFAAAAMAANHLRKPQEAENFIRIASKLYSISKTINFFNTYESHIRKMGTAEMIVGIAAQFAIPKVITDAGCSNFTKFNVMIAIYLQAMIYLHEKQPEIFLDAQQCFCDIIRKIANTMLALPSNQRA